MSKSSATHLGLTWDHPRGFRALDAAAARVNSSGTVLRWERQPLEGFESHPITELAANYDLLVLDHPHLGEAIAGDCLVPLERLFSQGQISTWSEQSVGRSMDSYLWSGQHWALPIDVATQVMAIRADLLFGHTPRTWQDVCAFCRVAPVGLSIAGPHAFLCLLSIAAALGAEPSEDDLLLPDDAIEQALGTLVEIYQHTPHWTRELNPIDLLEAMSTSDDLTLIPLVYGYVNYSQSSAHRPLSFIDAPVGTSLRKGSVLGGTGIAVTKRAKPDDVLLDHLAWLMSVEAQCWFIPKFGGQPAHKQAWLDPAINGACNRFYQATLSTTEEAIMRPRYDGYIAFQNKAARFVRDALADSTGADVLADRLRHEWRASRCAAQ